MHALAPAPALAVALVLALSACDGDEPTLAGGGGGDGGAVDARCPSGMVEIVQDRAELGEWEITVLEAFPGTVIPEQPYDLDAYCIAIFPLPGSEGQAWPSDGLSVDQLPDVEAVLDEHGRRLCSVGELLYAAATEDNWRHPYDREERQEVCDPDDFNPSPLGTFPGCASPLGVRDLEVRSSWATMDSATTSAVENEYELGLPGGGIYASWGGTSRDDTYYAPSNFGIHFHEAGDEMYIDDAVRICAEPGQVDSDQESAWSQQMAALVDAGSFALWLSGGGTTAR